MKNIGVVEGFFGPAWPMPERRSYAEFIAQTGGGFYIYAPKQDPFLRKRWREEWPADFLQKLRELAAHFTKHHVTFGVGLSPFGLGKNLSQDDETLLATKLQQLQSVGVELLGLFFDDMPSDANLAETQINCVHLVQRYFKKKIVFCPSYYTPDPILDKVFGQRPSHYLEDIAVGIETSVALAWTGPKVISLEMSNQHLQEVSTLLKRPPFIWENIFANDGPKNCKFLKLKPFTGREPGALDFAEAFAFNMMNQAELSKFSFLASRLVLEKNISAEEGWKIAVYQLATTSFAEFLEHNRNTFLESGLDKFTEEEKRAWLTSLSAFKDPAAREIEQWLRGEYVVGQECLTD